MRYLFDDHVLDTSRWELRRMGRLIKLRPKVFDVLVYLITHRDRVISRQEFLDRLWPQQFVGEATLNSCVMEARQALGDTGQAQRPIQTLHGRGYRFVAAVEEIGDSPLEQVTKPFTNPPKRLAQAMAASLASATTASAPKDHAPAVEQQLAHRRVTDRPVEPGDPPPTALEGERKPVTILCCGLADGPGLSIQVGSEATYRLMRAFFRLAQDIVQRYAGTLTQRLGDGFIAYFGAPVAHEDHARRAVLAAHELQRRAGEESALREPLRGAPVCLSMGLHTGLVIIGPLGEEVPTLYAALDDTTEMAGQLQRLAGPGIVLMSQATYRLVQEEVRVEAYSAPGMAALLQPLPVYSLCEVMTQRSGVTGRGGRPLSPFVGRRRELAALQALLAQVEAGQGQVVGIVGEPV
jgi:DNA-binding winged helix-turn-helix (wHTH) protein